MRGPCMAIGVVASVVLAGMIYFAATHQGSDPPPVSSGKYDPASEAYEGHLDSSRVPLATFIGAGEAATYFMDADCGMTEFMMLKVATKAAFDVSQPR